MSLPGIIFLLPFTVFGVLLFVFSFFSYKAAIDSFIERKTEEIIFKYGKLYDNS
jgi:hypothetical protein